LSTESARNNLARTLGVKSDEVEDSGSWCSCNNLLADLFLEIRELTNQNSLDDVVDNEYWGLLQQNKHFKFTIIEEKRKDLRPKELKDCEPQVTGEALALYVVCYFFQHRPNLKI